MNRSKLQVISCKLLSLFWLLATGYWLLILSGCGSVPPTSSDTHMKAIEFNQTAEKAFKKGDYVKAVKFYNEALRINRSIENTNGIAINLINLALVHRKLGDRANAHKHIDEIFNSHIAFSRTHLSEAAFIKAMLYMDEKQYDTLLTWLNKALSHCENAGCHVEGRIYNLKARVSLLTGDTNNAIVYASKGAELNKKLEDSEEIANSLRIIAEGKTIKDEYEDAKRLYEDALSIDKKLGLEKKIALDLLGIGNVLIKQRQCGDAIKYFKRALSVSENSGDKNGATQAKSLIEKCLK